MTVWNFKTAIDQGRAATRRTAYDQVIVWVQGGWYYVQSGDMEPMPYTTWAGVIDDLGDWADCGGWQFYRYELPMVQTASQAVR
jgi:hypothetical protein